MIVMNSPLHETKAKFTSGFKLCKTVKDQNDCQSTEYYKSHPVETIIRCGLQLNEVLY